MVYTPVRAHVTGPMHLCVYSSPVCVVQSLGVDGPVTVRGHECEGLGAVAGVQMHAGVCAPLWTGVCAPARICVCTCV